VTDDQVPVAVEVTDDRPHLLFRDDEGIVRASVDTDDAALRDWTETLHESFCAERRPFRPPTFRDDGGAEPTNRLTAVPRRQGPTPTGENCL